MSSGIYRTILEDRFPNEMEISFGTGAGRQTLIYRKVTWTIGEEQRGLRYGENPDQPAALYRLTNGNLVLGDVSEISPGPALVADAELLQSGKHPSKINLTDADAALGILRYFSDEPAAVIVKHNNPSGVALGSNPAEAYERALMADRIAAFGGTIALNREVDRELAARIASYYAEVVVAPEYSDGALAEFQGRKNLRVLRIRRMNSLHEYQSHRIVHFDALIDGSMIAQWSFQPVDVSTLPNQPASVDHKGTRHAVRRRPSPSEREDMRFGWFVESGVTSNSVIYVKDRCTVAIGTGEQDRVGVAQIARDKAYRKLADRLAFLETGEGLDRVTDPEERRRFMDSAAERRGDLSGSTMVSDAFFPFRDGVDVGLREGVSAVLQPGGSVRDWEIVDAVNDYGATMIFTGQRSFRH
jgi:phosphoribosylaminoimidazolecarboxamide formyltransferase/IMP cyclohydrolase